MKWKIQILEKQFIDSEHNTAQNVYFIQKIPESTTLETCIIRYRHEKKTNWSIYSWTSNQGNPSHG